VQQLECSLCPKQDPCEIVVVVGTGVVVVVVVVVVVGVVITVVVVVVVVATGPIGEPSLTQNPEQDGLELHWARHWEWAPDFPSCFISAARRTQVSSPEKRTLL